MAIKKNVEKVYVSPLNVKEIDVKIKQLHGLVQHPLTEKNKRRMRQDQMGANKIKKREKRDPQAEFEESFHFIKRGKFKYIENREGVGLGEVKFDGEVGFPSSGFKQAIVAAARTVDNLHMTTLRGALFVHGNEDDLTSIKYKKLIMREDGVTIGNGSTDLRYRPELRNWSAVLHISFNADQLSVQTIVDLVEIAGYSCGIGEMRPTSKYAGNYGRWTVVKD